MKTKEVEITHNGSPGKVVLQELTFGDKNELLEQATENVFRGDKMESKMNVRILKELGLLKGIKKAPFDITTDNIRKLRATDGEKLYKELDKLNSPEKKD
jgi:hypothetical protein